MNGYWIDTKNASKKIKKFKALSDKFDKHTHFLDCGNATLRYKKIGNGKNTIIINPDPPNIIEHYDELCTLLENHFQIIIVELPGFGFSVTSKKKFSFTLDEATQTVISFLEKLEIKQAIFSFPCVAGFIPYKIEELKPDLVKNIIAVQTPSWEEEIKWANRIDSKNIIKRPIIGQLLLKLKKHKIAKTWYKFALPKDAHDPKYYKTCCHALDNGGQYALASGLQGFFKDSKFQQKQKINKNALAFWGQKDRTHKRTEKESTKNYFEKIEIINFEDAGHFPDLEYPKEFSDILIKKFANE